MKKNSLVRVMAAIALMLAIGLNAEAQLGKKILQRAKNSAETKAQMEADRAVNKGLDKTAEAIKNPKKGEKNKDSSDNTGASGISRSSTGDSPTSGSESASDNNSTSGSNAASDNSTSTDDRSASGNETAISQSGSSQQAGSGTKLKPSAAAIAADPLASDDKVEFLHTKSPSEIRAIWEQLPDEVYYKPYYAKEYEKFYEPRSGYGTYFSDQLNRVAKFYYLACEAAKSESVQTFDLFEYVSMKTVDGKEGYAVTGQQAVHAWFAKFAADPESMAAYIPFSWARVLLKILEKAHAADNGTIIKLKGGTGAGLVEDYGAWIAKMTKESQRLEAIMYQQTPYTIMKDVTQAACRATETEKFIESRCWRLADLEQNINDLKNHPQFVDDNDYKQIVSNYNKLKGDLPKWLAELKDYYGPIDLPKTYPMNADITAKALVAAQKQFEGRFKVDKVVFLSNNWKINKENKYPYRTISRNMGVGLLTQRADGVWLYRWRNLVQSCDWDGNWKDDFAFQENTRARELKNYKP